MKLCFGFLLIVFFIFGCNAEEAVVFGKDILAAVWASASKDKIGATHISLVDVDAKQPQTFLVNINAAEFKTVSGRILKSDKLQNYNSFEKPNTIIPVSFTDAKLKGNKLELTLPPFSVVVLELK